MVKYYYLREDGVTMKDLGTALTIVIALGAVMATAGTAAIVIGVVQLARHAKAR